MVGGSDFIKKHHLDSFHEAAQCLDITGHRGAQSDEHLVCQASIVRLCGHPFMKN